MEVEKVKTISIHLPESLIVDIDRIAAADARTRASFIRKTLLKAVEVTNHREAHAERLRQARGVKQEIEA